MGTTYQPGQSANYVRVHEVVYNAAVAYWNSRNQEDSTAKEAFRRGMGLQQTAYMRLMITNNSAVQEAAVDYQKVAQRHGVSPGTKR